MVWNRKRSTGRPGVNPLKPCGRNWKTAGVRAEDRRQEPGFSPWDRTDREAGFADSWCIADRKTGRKQPVPEAG